jgi:hypothetical protein
VSDAAPRSRARPTFAESFPRDPALDEVVDAFARGDYGHVRARAPEVARAAAPDVKRAADELLSRTRPDPLAKVFFGLTLGLLSLLSGYWWWKAGHG